MHTSHCSDGADDLEYKKKHVDQLDKISPSGPNEHLMATNQPNQSPPVPGFYLWRTVQVAKPNSKELET